MASTHIQSYHQFIFSTKHRENLIPPPHRDLVHRYIAGIIASLNHKPLSIFAMPDHIHILVGMNGKMGISELVQKIKANSSRFINNKDWTKQDFRWQKGFGSFSYSHGQLNDVIRYIENQEKHHQKKTFKEEYLAILDKYGVEYDIRYVFD